MVDSGTCQWQLDRRWLPAWLWRQHPSGPGKGDPRPWGMRVLAGALLREVSLIFFPQKGGVMEGCLDGLSLLP